MEATTNGLSLRIIVLLTLFLANLGCVTTQVEEPFSFGNFCGDECTRDARSDFKPVVLTNGAPTSCYYSAIMQCLLQNETFCNLIDENREKGKNWEAVWLLKNKRKIPTYKHTLLNLVDTVYGGFRGTMLSNPQQPHMLASQIRNPYIFLTTFLNNLSGEVLKRFTATPVALEAYGDYLFLETIVVPFMNLFVINISPFIMKNNPQILKEIVSSGKINDFWKKEVEDVFMGCEKKKLNRANYMLVLNGIVFHHNQRSPQKNDALGTITRGGSHAGAFVTYKNNWYWSDRGQIIKLDAALSQDIILEHIINNTLYDICPDQYLRGNVNLSGHCILFYHIDIK
jgi:hypothetical protein